MRMWEAEEVASVAAREGHRCFRPADGAWTGLGRRGLYVQSQGPRSLG